MNAGLMDELVSVQNYTETIDTNTGEKLPSWSEYATAWARVQEQQTGSEEVNADRRENKQIVTFTCRYNANFSVNDRIVWQGNKYNIIAVMDIERRMYTKLHTEITYYND
jgi:SPP1 family predicted phage head-tail adaptor